MSCISARSSQTSMTASSLGFNSSSSTSARPFWYHFSNATHVSGMIWKSLLHTVFQFFYKALVSTYILNLNLFPSLSSLHKKVQYKLRHLKLRNKTVAQMSHPCSQTSNVFLYIHMTIIQLEHRGWRNIFVVLMGLIWCPSIAMLGKCSFLKGMQLTLLELALVLKSAV